MDGERAREREKEKKKKKKTPKYQIISSRPFTSRIHPTLLNLITHIYIRTGRLPRYYQTPR